MANPPFNVDEVDAEKVKGDKRLPFGLPGVNKSKKVSNANYLWLQYFYSYLNEDGRAGVVMSSQASSAGRDEANVRQKLVESGAVDMMIDIRSNFFYTRTVPCQLWFFDRAKERDEARRDHVLMLDARNIHRKVSRAIFDFSPEQQKNIAAIVWLYRGQPERFLILVESYLAQAVSEGQATDLPLSVFLEAGWQAGRSDGTFRQRGAWPRSVGGYVGGTHLFADCAAGRRRGIHVQGCDKGRRLGKGQEGRHERERRTPYGARRAAPCGPTLPESDQADRLGGEVGRSGRRHRSEGPRCAELGPLGQNGYQQGKPGAQGGTVRRRRSAAPCAVLHSPGGLAAGAVFPMPNCGMSRDW